MRRQRSLWARFWVLQSRSHRLRSSLSFSLRAHSSKLHVVGSIAWANLSADFFICWCRGGGGGKGVKIDITKKAAVLRLPRIFLN